jgi:hypothetical protein
MESENLEEAQEADTRERLLKKYAAKSIRIKTRHDYESRLRLYLASGRRLPATDVEIVEYIESAKVMSRKKKRRIHYQRQLACRVISPINSCCFVVVAPRK